MARFQPFFIGRMSLNRALISINSRLNGTQSYRANEIINRPKPEKKRSKEKGTLYSKISPLGNPDVNVTPVLDQWVQSGKKVRFAELLRIIHDLRKRNRFSQALQVSEWIKKCGMFTYTPTEYAVQVDLIGRVHGYLSAEKYFNNLTEQDKTEKTYGALLHCFVRQREIEKSLSHLATMKDKGLSLTAVAYNDIMSLYTNVDRHEKVPDVLNEMKVNGVAPDNLSYRICINSYGVRSDIGGMENVLREMECNPDIVVDWNTYAVAANFYIKAGLKSEANSCLEIAENKLYKKETVGYNHLISLHAHLGNNAHVVRLWELEKNSLKCINKDYINILKSLVRLDELEAAEDLLREWESSGNCYDFRVPNTIIDGYVKKGLYDKADTLLRDLMDKGKESTPVSWERLSAAYLQKDYMDKAVECMKVAVSLRGQYKGWKPDPKVLAKLVDFTCDQGRQEEADKFLCINNGVPESRQ